MARERDERVDGRPRRRQHLDPSVEIGEGTVCGLGQHHGQRVRAHELSASDWSASKASTAV